MSRFNEIIERLTDLGYPIAWNEFSDTKKSPAPAPPFICYLYEEIMDGPDNLNKIKTTNVSVELYSDRKPNETAETAIEKALIDVKFTKGRDQIPEENMFLTTYDFTVKEKI